MVYKKKSKIEIYLMTLNYIDKYNEDKKPETIFYLFDDKIRINNIFNSFFIKKMIRDKKMMDRRKIFINWFFTKYSGEIRKMSPYEEAAELTFLSKRRVEMILKESLIDEEEELNIKI